MKKQKKDTPYTRIPAGEFKAHCLRLIEEVSRKRAPLVITKRGEPMAKLVPFEHEPASLYGCMEGGLSVNEDIVGSTGEKWEADE
jgi:prevent-host-death family protein